MATAQVKGRLRGRNNFVTSAPSAAIISVRGLQLKQLSSSVRRQTNPALVEAAMPERPLPVPAPSRRAVIGAATAATGAVLVGAPTAAAQAGPRQGRHRRAGFVQVRGRDF